MRHDESTFLLIGCAVGALLVSAGACDSAGPGKEAIIESHHGVRVEDPYRWLESNDDSRVEAWGSEQAERARAYLDAIPEIGDIRERLTAILGQASVSYRTPRRAGGRLFAMKNRPPLQQPMLVVMPSADDPGAEVVLVDPNAIDPAGGTTIDFFEPSPDGRRVAVSLSIGGSENGDVHVYEVPSGKKLDDVVPRVNGGTAGGSLAWSADGTGFYYTRYPRRGERPDEDLPFYQQVWYHGLGTPETDDRYEVGREFDRIAEIQLHASRDGRIVLANVQKGDGGEFTHHLRRPDGAWVELTRYEDRIVHAVPGENGALYLVSRRDAPRGKILRLDVGDRPPSLESARTIVEEGDDSVDVDFAGQSGVWTGPDRLFVRYQQGGPTVVKVFGADGTPRGVLPAEPVIAIGDVVPLESGGALYRRDGYLEPPAWLTWDAATGQASPTKLVETSPADFSDCEVVRETAVSKDGTPVPVNIIRRKGTKLDGSNPALLYGYGGYGISQTPRFRPAVRLWLDRGGVYAVANIRGGGEFGEAWHRAGNLTAKQNVFDDFAAAARHLVSAGYTTPDRLALNGGSNGGLLMGAMITQHPEIARAVVSMVGVYDMIRVELTPNGAFNVPEFGTVKDPDQFRALYAYSPYHRVENGTAYPAILMLTGENDPRVDPWHSRKMVARLQEATSSGSPVLLRTSASTGHGVGTALAELIEEYTDMYAFLIHELRMERPPGRVS